MTHLEAWHNMCNFLESCYPALRNRLRWTEITESSGQFSFLKVLAESTFHGLFRLLKAAWTPWLMASSKPILARQGCVPLGSSDHGSPNSFSILRIHHGTALEWMPRDTFPISGLIVQPLSFHLCFSFLFAIHQHTMDSSDQDVDIFGKLTLPTKLK